MEKIARFCSFSTRRRHKKHTKFLQKHQHPRTVVRKLTSSGLTIGEMHLVICLKSWWKSWLESAQVWKSWCLNRLESEKFLAVHIMDEFHLKKKHEIWRKMRIIWNLFFPGRVFLGGNLTYFPTEATSRVGFQPQTIKVVFTAYVSCNRNMRLVLDNPLLG